MGHIKIDELSTSLKEYIADLGLSEEQVQQLITAFENEKIGNVSTLATQKKTVVGAINEVNTKANNAATKTDVGDKTTLKTTAKGNLVAAINELFQNANNGKELIATAIGEPLNSSDTFSAMSNGINGLTSSFKTALMNNGVTVGSTDKFKALIEKTNTEFTNKNNTIQTNRDKLYNLMLEGGYEVNSDMTIDDMMSLLEISGIRCNEIKQIACGFYHTFILKNDGGIWSCGYNTYGQLGLGDTTNRTIFTQVITNITNEVKQIVCGHYYTVILKNDGSVYSCGNNSNGQLGLGDTTTRNTFTQVITNINNDVKQVACGYYHTFIIKNDGSLWSCGNNEYGQLGLGNTTRNTFTQVTTNINNDVKQVACGYYHTFILKTDGSLWSCGLNSNGQLGLGNTTDRNTFTQVTTNINNDVKQIVCGGEHTFILKTDGSLWSCGLNSNGQLGLGNTTDRNTFTQVTTNINNDVKQVDCGLYHTFILKNDGSLWSCGYNNHGQLGLGDTTNRTIFTQVTTNINNDVKHIVCGYIHTFILKNDSSLWACGLNSNGQLGLGDTTTRNTFTQIPKRFTY